MKRLTYLLTISLGFTTSVFPVHGIKAYPYPIEIMQPDGNKVTIRLEGNAFHHRICDLSGRRLVEDASGTFRPATLHEQQMLASRANAQEPTQLPGLCAKKFPSMGSPKALVILVEYSDIYFRVEDPLGFYTRLFNQEGFSDYGATGSVRDWFAENSQGKFTPDFDVYGPVRLEGRMHTYGKNDYFGNEKNAHKIVTESTALLDDEIDFSEYDNDDDGYVDLIYLIYAAYGEADSGRSSAIWPHSYELTKAEPEKRYVYDGVTVDSYACSNEHSAPYDRPAGIGTIVHEFSHALGLPDLYSTVYNDAYTPGDWSPMDTGPYNNEARTPPYYSAFERSALGWLYPSDITEGSLELAPLHTSGEAYILRSDTEEKEYYLFENRRQEGYDLYLPDQGMAVWHIDFDQEVWEQNKVNNNPEHPCVDLIQADGTRDREWRGGATFPGAAGITAFGPSTAPALRNWSGQSLGLRLEHIREEDGKVLMEAMADDASARNFTDTCLTLSASGLKVISPFPVKVYSSSGTLQGEGPEVTVSAPGLYIAVCPDGQTRKVIL